MKTLLLIILSVAGACSGVGARSGPTAQSKVDSARAATSTVEVNVMAAGARVPGAEVVFQDADGTVLAHRTTDKHGQASYAMKEPGMVTVLAQTNLDDSLAPTKLRYTFVGVKPGDRLVFGDREAPPRLIGLLAVQLPGSFASADHYDIDLGCRRLSTPDSERIARFRVSGDCLGRDGAVDVLALAVGADGELLAHTSGQFRPGDTASLPSWSTQWQSLEIRFDDPPPQGTVMGVQLAHIADGLDFEGPMNVTSMATSPIVLPFALADFGEELRVIVVVAFGPPHEIQGLAGYARQFAGKPNSLQIDLDKVLPPRIPGVVLSSAEQERPEVVWTTDGNLADLDGGLLLLSWLEPGDESLQHTWSILLPPQTQGRFRLPALPDELSAFRPSKQAVFGAPSIVFVDTNEASGYDALRTMSDTNVFGSDLPRSGVSVRATFGGALPEGLF